jgi:hypothetical protein
MVPRKPRVSAAETDRYLYRSSSPACRRAAVGDERERVDPEVPNADRVLNGRGQDDLV